MKLKRELPLILIVLFPFIYLIFIWHELPEKVPMHWNIKGEIDRFGDKIELILIPILLPLFTYLIFLVIPKIDPKSNINKMGSKYGKIKTLIVSFMSILALFIIHSAKTQSLVNPNYLMSLLGVIYMIFGNYSKTLNLTIL